jgi:hypothetical protein
MRCASLTCQTIAAFTIVAALFFTDIFFYRRLLNRPRTAPMAAAAFRRQFSSCGLSFMPFYLSVLTVIKNEALYLPEWIEYHLLVGVENFHLILNNNEDNASDVLEPYVSSGIVNLSRWDGLGQQFAIYDHYVRKLRSESCWVAIIDVDEFLVPLQGHSVPVIVRRFESFPGVVVNWVTFGTNGKLKMESGLVMERFRNHTDFNVAWNWITKTIVNPRMTVKCTCHEHEYVQRRKAVDVKGREIHVYCTSRPPVHEILRINHYRTKSVEEFKLKLLRGRASLPHGGQKQPVPEILRREVPGIQDVVANDTWIEWAIPLVKENLARRYSS